MKSDTRPRRALLALATLIAAVGPVAGGVTASGDAPGGDIALLLPRMAATWDSRQNTDTPLMALLAVNEPLTAYQPDGTTVPLLASEFEHPDDVTYRYTLREGVAFSDGSPLTVDDVIFSFDLHRGEDTTSNAARYYAGITSIDAVGDNQVEMVLDAPDPQFVYTVARTAIVSKANYEAHGDDIGTPAGMVIGTGPYVFAEFTPEVSVRLEPNPAYWGDPAAFASVTFGTATDDSARLLALQSGDFDGVIAPPISQVAALEALGTYETVSTFDNTVYNVLFDGAAAPFDDPHVRRAFAHAIDRDALIQAVFGGRATIAQSLVPEPIVTAMGGDADVAAAYATLGEAFDFDLDVAREELAQSSVPDGFSIEVPVLTNDPVQSLVVQVIAQDLEEIGISVTPRQVDVNGWVSAFLDHEGSEGLIVDQWTGGTPDPVTIPLSFFTPGSVANWYGLDDPEVSAGLEAYMAADGDPATAQAALLDVLATAQAETPFVPIAFIDLYMLGDEDIRFGELTPFFAFVPLDQFVRPA